VLEDAPAGQPLSHEELLLEQIERLSAAIAARENELRRLKSEVELRDLYIQELHAQLRRQAERLEELERRVRALAPRAIPASHAASA
jgi:chromosome segregation ATPase